MLAWGITISTESETNPAPAKNGRFKNVASKVFSLFKREEPLRGFFTPTEKVYGGSGRRH